MRRWNSILETFYFPLEVLYIASIIFGMSTLLLGQSFNAIFTVNNTIIILVLDLFRNFSIWLIQAFPLLFLLRAVYHRNDDSLVVVTGILAYVAFHISTAFFAPSYLPLGLQEPVLNISFNASRLVGATNITAINTGIIGSIIVLIIVRTMVNHIKRRSPYSLFSFVDKNVSTVFMSLLLSLITGVLFAYIVPYFISFMQNLFNVIASNMANPINLFVYGIVNRLSTLFGFGHWMNQQFWFGSLGGTWSNASGSVFNGDISMWTAQLASSINNFGAGKLITPYYILNGFVVPAYILASYQTYTDKLVRRRLLMFVIVAVLSSWFLNTLLPIEIFMLVSTPLLFVYYIFLVGLLFAILPSFNIVLGYSYVGSVYNANPGSLLDILILLRNPNFQRNIIIVLLVGLFIALITYAVTTYYYRKGAIGLIVPDEKDRVIYELLDAIGEIDNIKLINSSVGKVIIQVNDRTKVDFNKIHHRVNKIVETRAGYAISYGSSSYMIYNYLKALQKSTVESA